VRALTRRHGRSGGNRTGSAPAASAGNAPFGGPRRQIALVVRATSGIERLARATITVWNEERARDEQGQDPRELGHPAGQRSVPEDQLNRDGRAVAPLDDEPVSRMSL